MRSNIIYSVVILISLASLTACTTKSKDQKAIEQVAYNYLDAMANYRIDEAEQYASHATVESSIKLAKFFMTMADSNFVTRNTPGKVEITDCYMSNDSTAVVKYHKTSPSGETNDSIWVIKEEGKWMAHFAVKPLSTR